MENRYDFIVALARGAGEKVLVLRDKGMEVSIKNDNPQDILTNVDIEVGKYITDEIKEQFPGEQIYSEEVDIDTSSGSFWAIDPVDGTANFSIGIPHYATVIAYVEHGVPTVGAVYNPVTKELFSFEKGKGAFLNGQPIQMSKETDLSASTIILSSGRKPEAREWGLRMYTFLLSHVNKVRILSSSALDLCFVACGRVQGCAYSQLTTLDIIAALGILNEVGGIIDGVDGPLQKLSKEPQRVFVANNREILTALRNA